MEKGEEREIKEGRRKKKDERGNKGEAKRKKQEERKKKQEERRKRKERRKGLPTFRRPHVSRILRSNVPNWNVGTSESGGARLAYFFPLSSFFLPLPKLMVPC